MDAMTVGRLTWGLYVVGLLMVAAFIGVAVLGQNNVSTIHASLEQGVSPLDLSNFDEVPDVDVQLVCVLRKGAVPSNLNDAQMAALSAVYPFETATVPGLAWLTETGIYEMFPLLPQMAEIKPSTSTGPCISLAEKPTLIRQGRSAADGFFYLIRTTQIAPRETCCGQ